MFSWGISYGDLKNDGGEYWRNHQCANDEFPRILAIVGLKHCKGNGCGKCEVKEQKSRQER